MKDIKPKKKNAAVQTEEPDLSFMEEEAVDTQHILQPHSSMSTIRDFLLRPLVTHVMVGAVLFGLGLGIGALFTPEQNSVSKSSVVESSKTQEQTENRIPAVVAGSEDQLFDPTIYHKIELNGGDVYYSLITDTSADHYTIQNVFYTVEETSAESGQPKLTLALYDSVAGEPTQGVLLPREQVKAVSPLAENSSIVTAINQYMAENGNPASTGGEIGE